MLDVLRHLHLFADALLLDDADLRLFEFDGHLIKGLGNRIKLAGTAESDLAFQVALAESSDRLNKFLNRLDEVV